MAKRPYRINPKHHDSDQFTVCECEKCGEYYEPEYEHICKKRNSYPLKNKKEDKQ